MSVSHEQSCMGLVSCDSGGRECLFLSVDADCVCTCQLMHERTSNCLFSYTHMLLICPHALLLCFRYLMDVFLFSLCVRLQRRVLEPKQPNCAFGLIIRDPMLWNNEPNTNQSWSCCWFCVYHRWSSLDCINVLQRRACTVVSLQTFLLYVAMYMFDWWWLQCCGSLGKIPCLFCTFSTASPDPQAVWFILASKMLYTSALQLGVCWSLALSKQVFTHNQRNGFSDVDPNFAGPHF